jgi:hypothetical protein
MTIDEIIQNVVETNPELFPDNIHHASTSIQQNGSASEVPMDGDSTLTAADEGVATERGVATEGDAEVSGGTDNNAVLSTLRSLVEAMNGAEGGTVDEGQGTERMEVWPQDQQQGRLGRLVPVFNLFHLFFFSISIAIDDDDSGEHDAHSLVSRVILNNTHSK